MNVDNELTDFDAAGALTEELPWWGFRCVTVPATCDWASAVFEVLVLLRSPS